jgi:hypothetical protein
MNSSFVGVLIGSAAMLIALLLLLIDWRKHFRSIYGGFASFLDALFTLIAMSVLIYRSLPAIALGFAVLAFLFFLASLLKIQRYRHLDDRA